MIICHCTEKKQSKYQISKKLNLLKIVIYGKLFKLLIIFNSLKLTTLKLKYKNAGKVPDKFLPKNLLHSATQMLHRKSGFLFLIAIKPNEAIQQLIVHKPQRNMLHCGNIQLTNLTSCKNLPLPNRQLQNTTPQSYYTVVNLFSVIRPTHKKIVKFKFSVEFQLVICDVVFLRKFLKFFPHYLTNRC